MTTQPQTIGCANCGTTRDDCERFAQETQIADPLCCIEHYEPPPFSLPVVARFRDGAIWRSTVYGQTQEHARYEALVLAAQLTWNGASTVQIADELAIPTAEPYTRNDQIVVYSNGKPKWSGHLREFLEDVEPENLRAMLALLALPRGGHNRRRRQ